MTISRTDPFMTVNGVLADRKNECFHREVSVANTNQPVWQNVTNIAGTFTNKGGSVFPANAQVLVYDADGNLSFDGIWNYQWDGENRLISMSATNVTNIATPNRLRLDFAYDYMGRRVQKIVSVWNASITNYVPSTTNVFVYDGWNLLAVFNPQSSILQSFMWGQDLSGTMSKAGGVGGLLMASISGTNCFATYDGNGNITSLINAIDKSLAARYEYSPYGELLRETGLLARQNPFRFSTKFWDGESGLIYYCYRYYDPIFGRWINREPESENDNINMNAFVHNNSIMGIDMDGKSMFTDWAWNFGKKLFTKMPSLINQHFNPGDFTIYATKTFKGGPVGLAADLIINPAASLDMLSIVGGMDAQNVAFMQNAQHIITSRLETKTAIDTDIGVGVGISAAWTEANGGSGDDLILDASLNAAGTMGVDSSETIFGVAAEAEQDGN